MRSESDAGATCAADDGRPAWLDEREDADVGAGIEAVGGVLDEREDADVGAGIEAVGGVLDERAPNAAGAGLAAAGGVLAWLDERVDSDPGAGFPGGGALLRRSSVCSTTGKASYFARSAAEMNCGPDTD
jgi:hypothetical protein